MSFPKFGFFPLIFISLIPLLFLSDRTGRKGHFRIFFLFSFSTHLILLYWIPDVMVNYGGMDRWLGIFGLVILAAYISFFFGLCGILIKKALSSVFGSFILIPAIWVSKDLVLEKLFGGFPWEFAGYSQYTNQFFIQPAEIGGIHLITFLVIFVNVGMFRFIKERKSIHLLILASTFSAVYVIGILLFQSDIRMEKRSVLSKAGIIQPNTGQNYGSGKSWRRVGLDELFEESAQLKSRGAEFVVWPEYSIGLAPLQNRYIYNRLKEFSSANLPLLAGFTDYKSSAEMYNSFMLFDGEHFDKYDKVKLVPFGEYIPFKNLFFFVNKITDEISDFTPGREIRNLELKGKRISTPICYEIIYAEIVREFINRGGQVIVLASNDSWYGTSSAPYQLLSMSVFRSVENRRYILRSTSNGISAVIDPRGLIIRRIPLNKKGSFVSGFRYRDRETVFNRAGFLFPYILFILTVLYSLHLFRKKHK